MFAMKRYDPFAPTPITTTPTTTTKTKPVGVKEEERPSSPSTPSSPSCSTKNHHHHHTATHNNNNNNNNNNNDDGSNSDEKRTNPKKRPSHSSKDNAISKPPSPRKRPSRWGPSRNTTTTSTTTTPSSTSDPVGGDGNETDSSSSVPSSTSSDDDGEGSVSSSSVPSSTTDEEEDDDTTVHHHHQNQTPNQTQNPNQKEQPLLRVIAPEQKPSLAGTEPSRWTQEGLDDFDITPRTLRSSPPLSSDTVHHTDNAPSSSPTTKSTTTTVPTESNTPPLTEDQILHQHSIRTALSLSNLPLPTLTSLWNLQPFLRHNLQTEGHTHFFPVQCLVLPDTIGNEPYRGDKVRARDVCVGSPTGSGKTLAFVLPVLNSLGGRRVRRLRALVVLPGRDLAMQVHSVFKRYSKGSDLTIGLAIGQTDFQKEQKSLVLGSQEDCNDQGDDGGNGNSSTSFASNCYSHYSEESTAKILYALDQSISSYSSSSVHTALNAHCPPLRGVSSYPIPTVDGTNVSSVSSSFGSFTNGDAMSAAETAAGIGGRSAVDVLVCTPGRLVEHLDRTPGFTLMHLRFLILDEADRLLSQRYQNWIERVRFAAGDGPRRVRRRSRESSSGGGGFVVEPVTWRKANDEDEDGLGSSSSSGGGGANDDDVIHMGSGSPLDNIDTTVCHPVPLRKWLFSATLTQDPQKLAPLGLVNPKRYDAHHLSTTFLSSLDGKHQVGGGGGDSGGLYYSLPEGLSEFRIECKAAEQKLPVLSALLLDWIEETYLRRTRRRSRKMDTDYNKEDINNDDIDDGDEDDGIAVVFTSSVDSTHRLTRLLQLLWCARRFQHGSGGGRGKVGTRCGPTSSIREFSSSLSQEQRFELVEHCRRFQLSSSSPSTDVENEEEEGGVRIVVCSDGMSRGMDLPSVTTVVNYDIPSHAKTYVHRCGRTARAGRKGRAINLVTVGQVGVFEKMHLLVEGVGNGNAGGVKAMGVRKETVGEVLPLYKRCVAALRKVMEMEDDGDLCPMTPLDEAMWGPMLGFGNNQRRRDGA